MKKIWKNKPWMILSFSVLGLGTFFLTVFATHTPTSPTADSHPFGIFENWSTWTNTQYPVSTDKNITVLYWLGRSNLLNTVSNTNGHSTPRKYSLVDINGDALTDLLYHNFSNTGGEYFAILLNSGNGYSTTYKCVHANNRYYGDCAGTGSAHPGNLWNSLTSYTTTLKPADTWFHFLYLTGIYNRKPHGSETYGETQTANNSDLVDINGDGLTDMIYRTNWYAVASNTSWPDDAGMDTAVFLNEGGTGWQLAYRCRTSYDKLTTTVTDVKYYGDCANL